MNEQSNPLSSAQLGDSPSRVKPEYSTPIEQRLGEIECWAIGFLKPFVEETDASALESHILDLGEGVRIYQLKSNAPEAAEIAIDAIHKCELVENCSDQLHLDASAQAIFELGRILERFVTTSSVTAGLGTKNQVAVTQQAEDTISRSNKNVLQRLKRQAAEDAISNALSANPGLDEKQLNIQAANELNISPRTLSKWCQF